MGAGASCCTSDGHTRTDIIKEPYSLYPVKEDKIIYSDDRLSPYAIIIPNKVIEPSEMDEVNETDVEESLNQITNNEDSLVHCCLNNLPLEKDMVDQITAAMIRNTTVKKLDMCNCAITDESVEGYINMLKTNNVLQSLSLETNRITGKHLKKIVESLEFNETLRELRIANQYFATGVGDEMAIAKALAKNTSLCKFSLNWKNGGARNTADRIIMRNTDNARKKRQGHL